MCVVVIPPTPPLFVHQHLDQRTRRLGVGPAYAMTPSRPAAAIALVGLLTLLAWTPAPGPHRHCHRHCRCPLLTLARSPCLLLAAAQRWHVTRAPTATVDSSAFWAPACWAPAAVRRNFTSTAYNRLCNSHPTCPAAVSLCIACSLPCQHHLDRRVRFWLLVLCGEQRHPRLDRPDGLHLQRQLLRPQRTAHLLRCVAAVPPGDATAAEHPH